MKHLLLSVLLVLLTVGPSIAQPGHWRSGIDAELLQGQDTAALRVLFTDSTFYVPGTWMDITQSVGGESIYISINHDSVAAAKPVGVFREFEFLTLDEEVSPWTMVARNGGTHAAVSGDANHPGIVKFSSSTTPNSGFYILTYSTTEFLMAGSEYTDFVFYLDTITNTTTYMGFHDATLVTEPVDGVNITIQDDSLWGLTSSNSSRDTTATKYGISAATWYWGNVTLSTAADTAFFTLKNGTTGAVLWAETLTADIPTGAGRVTGHGVVSTNSGITAYPLIRLDYMNFELARRISAGRPN